MLELIDKGTLIVLMCAGCICFGLITLLGRGWRDQSIRCWGLGYLLAGVGLTMYVLRGLIPDWISIQVANSLMLLGIGMMLNALITHTQQRQFRSVLIAWLIISIVGFNLISLPPVDSVRLSRTLFISIVVAFSQGFAIVILLRSSIRRSTLTHVLISTHAMLMTVFAVRAVYLVWAWLDWGYFPVNARVPEVGSVVFFLVVLSFVFLQAPSYMLIRKEEADRRMVRAETKLTEQLAERELEQRFYESRLLAERAETIEHFARGIAHDGNNVIGVLQLGMGQLRERVARGQKPSKAALDLMETGLARARTVNSGLIALSGTSKPAIKPVCIATVVDEVGAMLTFSVPEAVRVTTHATPGLYADSHHPFLVTALLNLGRNGAEAMGSHGGRLHIAAELVDEIPHGDKQIGTVVKGPLIDITVTDEGPGMVAADFARVFDPMVTTKAETEGHGYGLYMVRAVTERIGAALVIQTSEHTGTVVHFLLAQGDGNDPATRRA
ncbi:sensor histidine kinase [Spiribacter pallidus]|uniref:sensor histidine kinase n=1 Tax=Spiribacter pallidus TaxID=1987936 RepID=UPI00349FDD50